ncbi:DUF2807 domain-containing protein [Prolixibacteraceae bacterium JC049]|nr:DUF2807 domain-containing protein [Prolixibacteraceae bacterium JC049]
MKTTKQYLLGVAVILLVFLSGCVEVSHVIVGNGRLVSEFRAMPNFEKIDVKGAFKVRVEAGNVFEVKVTAESNLQEYVSTEIYGRTLEIAVRGIDEIEAKHPIELLVITPRLDAVTLDGSGNIYVANFFDVKEADVRLYGSGNISAAFDCDDLDVRVLGSGQVEVEGTAIDADLLVEGSGEILGYDMKARYSDATINGSGQVFVSASRRLDVVINGSGDVYYINDPDVTYSIAGTGRLIHQVPGQAQVEGKLKGNRQRIDKKIEQP